MSGAFTINLTVTAPPSDTAPSVSSTTPANNATDVARDANVDITFSEAVSVAGSWFDITCGTSGNHSATVSGGPTTFTLDPGSDFAKGEVCTVTVHAANVTDQDANDPPDNMAANYAFSFTVVANVPPTAEANGPYSGDEGSAISLSSAGSNDSDGTIASYAWSYSVVTADAGATCSFSDATAANPTITCDDDGSYTVKLKVTDDDGAESAEDTAALTVGNAAPVITSFSCPTDPVAVNTTVSLGGSFTDAGANDTHTASYAWGDGSTSAGAVAESNGSGTVSGSHIYTTAGIYTPSLTVTDDDAGSDTESCMYVVVYDPSAGFVTGGGWIMSPAGAYLVDPTMAGKATFGFVSRYKKGATTPEGNTEFQFHAASLNFKSTSYQWLVVSGSKATYKGYGTINGAGNYGFLLSAIDGSPDTFRIKIWEVGGDVVYDNNLGGGDDADPASALGGGSIVIHTGKK